jgi:hypothetical protein
MKLLLENWRKFLKEEELLKESVSDHYDTLSEDDLYDLDIEDLLDLRDFIEDFGADQYSRSRDTKDLYPTIMARIEAIEDEEVHTPPPDRQVENLYDGEFILKLMRAFFISANQGIELSSMIPGAESLSEEFKRTREQVSMLIQYAEDKDYSPWLYAGTDWEKEVNPDTMTNNIRLLMNQIISPDKGEGGITEDEQEIIDGYHKWIDSVDGLKKYAEYSLHGAHPHAAHRAVSGRERFINNYDFIKKWAGED